MSAVPASLTLRLPGTLVGFAGSLLVAVGGCSSDFSMNERGWAAPSVQSVGALISRPAANLLITLGVALLCLGWWLLRPRRYPNLNQWTVLVAWLLPLLAVPPIMSADPFLYADLGYILSQGRDPYVVRLGGLGGPYAPWVDVFWAGHGVAYPPLSLQVSRTMVGLAGFDPYWGVIAQRIPALAGVALLGLLVPRLADETGVNRSWAWWLGVLNPILVVHLVGGAHNDALMAGVVILAIWISLRRLRWISASLVLAPLVLGLAMGLKQQAGLAVIAVAALPVLDRLRAMASRVAPLWLLTWRTAVAAVVTIATFVVTSLATGLGFGWIAWLSEMGRARTLTLAIAISDAVGWLGPDVTTEAFALVGLVAAGLLGWLLLTKPDDPMAVVAWGSVLVLFMSQALHPWYVGLSLALLALCRLRPRAAAAVVWTTMGYLMAYTVQFVFVQPVLVAIPAGVAFGVLGCWLHRRTTGGEPITLG